MLTEPAIHKIAEYLQLRYCNFPSLRCITVTNYNGSWSPAVDDYIFRVECDGGSKFKELTTKSFIKLVRLE